MSPHVLLSSENQDWQTPEWFLELVRRVGPIILDPATAADNPTKAKYFYSPTGRGKGRLGSCGLAGTWARDGLAFINPRYGGHLSGDVDPAYELTKKCKVCGGTGSSQLWDKGEILPCDACGGAGRVITGYGRGWAARIAQDQGEWIALVPVRTETDWWRLLHSRCGYAVLWSSPKHGRRINFVDPETGKEKKGSNLASTVFYHGQRPDKFLSVFAAHGRIIPGQKKLVDLLTPRG